MARGLGHGDDARLLARRGKGHRTLWNRRLRLFSPRRRDGRWLAHYDPRTGAGQFDEGGAYQYAWTGHPWKTATVARAAETLVTNGPEGMTGNDDLGTVSAWYVLSALGLYPTMSGGFFVLSTPQFPHAVLSLGAIGSRQGGTLSIDAPRASATRRYVASARIDGRPVRRAWLTRAAIARGGRLAFDVSAHPTRWGTAPSAGPPSVVRTR